MNFKSRQEKDTEQRAFQDNPYQYIRGIRFRADVTKAESEKFRCKYKFDKQENKTSDEQMNPDDNRRNQKKLSELSELAGLLLNFHAGIKDFDSKNGSLIFRKKLFVNKTWFKNQHREIFYQWIKNDAKTGTGKKDRNIQRYPLVILEDFFKEWMDKWEWNASQLKRASEQPVQSQFRRSYIAESIRDLLSRRQFHHINGFLTEVHDGNDPILSEKIQKLKNILEAVWKKLKTAEQIYLPSQSSGMEIAKASFNYHTVDKKRKEYYEDQIQAVKKKLYEKLFSRITKSQEGKYEWSETNQKKELFSFSSEQEIKWVKGYCNKYEIQEDPKGDFSLSLDQTHKMMKAFKAEQRSVFDEIVTHIATNKRNSYEVKNKKHILKDWLFSYEKHNMEDLSKEFSLFSFEEQWVDSKFLKSLKKGKKTGTFKHNTHNQRSVSGNQNKQKLSAEDAYNTFLKLTMEIQEKNKIKQQIGKRTNISGMRENPGQLRGKFLFKKDCYFKNYGGFCENYRKIAQQRGCFIAQIKGVKKEEQEAKQTDFWSLIYCDQDKKQLWLVPKEKRKEAKDEIIKNRENYAQENPQHLCWFESLTMRALHKLCFAEQSSFVSEMPTDLKDMQKEAKEVKTSGDKQKLKEKDQKKLDFFKKLLKHEYARERLPILKAFDSPSSAPSEQQEAWLSIDRAKSLLDFEEALETACYHLKKMVFNESEKSEFLKNFDVTVLDISSYDLEERNKNIQPFSENRYHTDLWKAFWENINTPLKDRKVKGFSVGLIRLNPEVKIRYRKEDKDLRNYLKIRGFPVDNKKFKHRRLQEQFTAHFTLTVNAGKRYEDLAFARPEELFDKINDFNEKLNNEIKFKTAWKYGIDRGNKELAALCLARFNLDGEVYKLNGKDIVKPEFAKIECYTFRKEKYDYEGITREGETKKRIAVKNLSYFIQDKYLEDKDFFAHQNTSCLDLTTAKVIRGKIITNGDIMTYLKIKKAKAKRKLYELYHKKQISESAVFKWCGKNLKIQVKGGRQGKKNEAHIYYYDKRYENLLINKEKNIIYNETHIKNALEHYLNEIRQNNEEHTPSIQKINHLRDALTANMVGVICHLQKTYKGFVVLEDLEQETIEDHFSKSNANISRRLENALYGKFQSLGLVPPHVKNIISLRETVRKKQRTKSLQIGAVVFVDKGDTSRNCPYCEKTQNKALWNESKKSSDEEQTVDEWKKQKKQGRFCCKGCGFDTDLFKSETETNTSADESKRREEFDWFKSIDNPDKVAAYNIAKKIKKNEEIERWK